MQKITITTSTVTKNTHADSRSETSDMPLGPRNDYVIKIKNPGRHATGSTLLNVLPIRFSSTNNFDFVRLRLFHQNGYISQSRHQHWYHQSHHHPKLINHQMYRPRTERHLPVFASISKGPQPFLCPMSNPHRTLESTMNRLASATCAPGQNLLPNP